jgi:hypothetical protein
MRDWSDPHYERMLYDNAQLLRIYARGSAATAATAEGIASFLLATLRLADGGFASAQDSESTVDGARVEGGYYRLDADGRARQSPPALDEKIVTGWNGLAIGALASAGAGLDKPAWIEAAVRASELVSAEPLVRARLGTGVSSARPTLEDFGMLSEGLIDLALATGEVRFAIRARELVAECASSDLAAGGFRVPGGADPVLTAHGLVLENDPSEGAYPSGLSAMSRAAIRLSQLGETRFLDTAVAVLETIAPLALSRPLSFGSALGAMAMLAAPLRQLVVVTENRDGAMAREASRWLDGVGVVVTPEQSEAFAAAGFELFEGRQRQERRDTAYLCENFVCRLPTTSATELAALLG